MLLDVFLCTESGRVLALTGILIKTPNGITRYKSLYTNTLLKDDNLQQNNVQRTGRLNLFRYPNSIQYLQTNSKTQQVKLQLQKTRSVLY